MNIAQAYEDKYVEKNKERAQELFSLMESDRANLNMRCDRFKNLMIIN